MKMKNLFAFVLFLFLMSSCASLTSTTFIKPNESFVLGDNEHGSFSVRLKNISPNKLELWKAPIDGGRHSPVNVEPNETVKVKVPKNTALRIDNKNATEASVELLVKGDVGLSMGYKKN
jgi:hypothetical protein